MICWILDRYSRNAAPNFDICPREEYDLPHNVLFNMISMDGKTKDCLCVCVCV